MVLKICVQCGKEFEAKRSDAKTCSKQCRQKYSYHKKHVKSKKTCIICGKEFTPEHGHQRYCSKECSDWAAELDRMNNNSTRWDSSDDYFDRDNDLPEYYYD